MILGKAATMADSTSEASVADRAAAAVVSEEALGASAEAQASAVAPAGNFKNIVLWQRISFASSLQTHI